MKSFKNISNLRLSRVSKNTTVISITPLPLQNTRNKMGNSFLTYSARDNNCQNFVLSLLRVFCKSIFIVSPGGKWTYIFSAP